MIGGERGTARFGPDTRGDGEVMTKALDEIHRLFAEGTLAGLSDVQLLDRFAVRGDGDAFAAIVARHGAMVVSVCRSAVGSRDDADADDAFQATFLVLVRRAGSFPLRGSLAGWLYRVARRVARQARIEASRRRARERIAAGRREVERRQDDPERDELRRIVHQELAHLPEHYRTPIVLCDVHGLTRDEAAEAIGCPPGTVAGRLARARGQLRDRLARHGVSSSVSWPAALGLSTDDLSRLFQRATEAAVAATRGAAVNTAAARLAARASCGLLAARITTTLAIFIALGASGVATAVIGFRTDRGSRGKPPPAQAIAVAPIPQTPTKAQAPINPEDPATADIFTGRVIDTDGKPLDGAKMYLVPQLPWPTHPGEVRAVTAAGGRFRFSAKDLTYTALDGLPARRAGLLIAAAEGYGTSWVRTWGQAGTSFILFSKPVKGADWTLTLPRDDAPIRGRLIDRQGHPLAGAAVKLTVLFVPTENDLNAHLEKQRSRRAPLVLTNDDRSLETPEVLAGVTTEAVTDADGRFRLEGLGRERLVRLRVQAPGMVDTSIDVMTREAPEVRIGPASGSEDLVTQGAAFTLALRPGRTVSGVVRDKASGAPLADVWVGPGVSSINGLIKGRYPHATDAQGRFAVSGIDPDRTKLEVLAVPKPGQPHFLAKAVVNDAGEAVVDCPRGVPFHLTLRDEARRPIEAEVTYSVINPNPHFLKVVDYIRAQAGTPLSRAARKADGSYLGVALPGPGVVVAKTPRKAGYRPAHADPKAFFAPGKTDWTPQELITAYGTHDTLSLETFYGGAWEDQHDFAAIVLVNPAEDAEPLELVALVVPERPRQVTLLDPEGRPVVGVQTNGLTYHPSDHEMTLRAATIPITGLHPDRARRITCVKEDRKLIGFLLARGDGDAPYTVRMQPWAAVTGRVVDEQGRPLPVQDLRLAPLSRTSLAAGAAREFAAHDDPEAGIFPTVSTDAQGRFRVERLVPGLSYSADIYLGVGRRGGPAFEDLKLAPGEVRDLGDLRATPPIDFNAKPRTTVAPPKPGL